MESHRKGCKLKVSLFYINEIRANKRLESFAPLHENQVFFKMGLSIDKLAYSLFLLSIGFENSASGFAVA